MTAKEMVGSDEPLINVALALRSELKRFGIEKMLSGSAIIGHIRRYASMAELADDEELSCADVIVIEAAEISDHSRDAISDIRARGHGARVLALLEDGDEEIVSGWTEIMVDSFLYGTELTSTALHNALIHVINGIVCMPTKLAETLLNGRRSARRGGPDTITGRERQVLGLIAEGLSNKQIARRLNMSDHNVKRIVASILTKLNCPNRTMAAIMAVQLGYVSANLLSD